MKKEEVFTIRRKHAAVSMPIFPFQELRGMSLAAKGLLALLLSFPEKWEIRMTDIISRSKNGRDSTRKALNELINEKYVVRIYFRENGRIKGSQYVVFDEPGYDD